MYEQSRQAQLDEYNLQQQREDARRAIIEEERQKLLQEHAVKLYGYLPKELERCLHLHILDCYSANVINIRELGIKGSSSPNSSRAGSPSFNSRPPADHSPSPPRYEEQKGFITPSLWGSY
jgi:hypothetical protein